MQVQNTELQPGSVLGRYELLLPIAKGGMGQVWAARLHGTRGFSKLVAIKTLLPSEGEDKQLEAMLLSEAALASRIKHPNVVEGLDLGEQNGTLYFVMEWVSGEALDYVVKAAGASGGLSLPVIVHIAAQACGGLHAAHDARDDEGAPLGLVHRDVSPQNLLVAYSGAVKLTDFGVAKATQLMPQASVVGQVKGKFAYMSPEQVRGARLDGRSDIFAMGVVLYRMVTGKHPFKGLTPAETLGRILSTEPPPRPSTLVPDLPAKLDAIIMRAIASERDDRFATAREMREALENALPESTPPCDERDIEALMIKLFGIRFSERRRALTLAAERVDAKGGPVVVTNWKAPFQPRSQSTMRAVTVASAIPSLDEQVVVPSSVMPPPALDPTLSRFELFIQPRRWSARRRLVVLGASAVSCAALGLLAGALGFVHTGGSANRATSAASPLGLEPLAAAPSAWLAPPNQAVAPAPGIAEVIDLDRLDAGASAAAAPAQSGTPSTTASTPAQPHLAGPNSRDRHPPKTTTEGAPVSPRPSNRAGGTDQAIGPGAAAAPESTTPTVWDPLRARK